MQKKETNLNHNSETSNKMNIMKTSLLVFATATAVPFITLVGLSVLGAFSIMTALSVTAMISLDYDNSRDLGYAVKTVSATPAAKSVAETHPLAA